jgi:hypothetical protein
MFTEKDLQQIKSKGITVETVEKQIKNFKKGFPYIKLAAPATVGNGIHRFSEEETAALAAKFDADFADYRILKFVPASGAASRMFKVLFEFMENYKGEKEDIEKFEADKSFNSPYQFINNLKKFAFFEDLKNALYDAGLPHPDDLIENKDFKTILEYFLTEKGLGYAQLPKGLLLFHKYDDGARLAVEEHLVEGAHYATDNDGTARIHLTVSPEHQEKFEKAIAERKGKYEEKFGIKFEVQYSQQKPSTDMIAVDMNNEPFRKEDSSLLFRPGGHGALIENLNDMNSEIVFIKNIDNVVPDRLKETTYLYKKVIGGLLFKLQEKTFDYLDLLEDGNLTDEEVEEIRKFAEEELQIFIPAAYKGYEKMDRIDFLFTKLNRPMRVCGMVKNEGEPGGGPYWVTDEQDNLSLQIVESSQMDLDDPEQAEIVSKATHFNPVDLVCGIENYQGEKFDLTKFTDPNTGFISIKSLNGKDLKAQELPGLWNGAMADWITVFVETPLITFNPVKTINDLLRREHQPES